jgi:hypothetical protein
MPRLTAILVGALAACTALALALPQPLHGMAVGDVGTALGLDKRSSAVEGGDEAHAKRSAKPICHRRCI